MGCDRRIILIVLPPRDQSREPIFPSAPTRLITPTRFPPPSMRLQFHSSLRPSVKQSTFVLPFRTLILVHPVPLRASWQHSTSSGKPGASRMARKAARRGSGPRSATVRRSAGGGGAGMIRTLGSRSRWQGRIGEEGGNGGDVANLRGRGAWQMMLRLRKA